MATLNLYIDESWPDSGGRADIPWAITNGSKSEPVFGVAQGVDELPKARACEIVIPANVALLTEVEAPERNRKLVFKALRFAVEDKVVAESEKLHAGIIGPVLPGGKWPVAVLDRQWMEKTLGLLAEKGVFPNSASVETLMPPVEQNSITVVWDGVEGFMRSGEFSGGALDAGSAASPPAALKLAIDEARNRGEEVKAVRLYLAGGAIPPDVSLWGRALGVECRVVGAFNWPEAVAKGAGRVTGDFLSGGLARPSRLRKMKRGLKLTLALTGAVVLTHAGFITADWILLKREARLLESDMRSSFKKAFPEAKAIVDPPLQMRRNLADLRWRAGGRDMNDLAPMLAEVTTALGQDSMLRGFDYDKGVLKVDAIVPEEGVALIIRDRLMKTGMDVKMGDIKPAPEGFEARLVVTRSGVK